MIGFFRALAYPFRGLAHLLRRPRLWRFAVLPFAVNLIVYTALAVLLYWAVRHVLVGEWLSGWPSWAQWIVGVVAALSGLVLMAFTFTIVGNVIAGPLLDLLAERALEDLRGAPLPRGGPWLPEAAASVGRQMVKLFVFGSVQLGLLLLLLVPVAGLLHPVLATLVTVAFLAMEYLDYPLGADRRPLGERLGYVFRHPATSFGFGTALLVIVLVPLVGYLALPCCVVGATLLYHDLEKSEGRR